MTGGGLDNDRMCLPTTSARHPLADCRFRTPVSTAPETARCGLLAEILGPMAGPVDLVTREICEACGQSFSPTVETVNPVVASLIFGRTQTLARDESQRDAVGHWNALRKWAERHLDIESPALPPIPVPAPSHDQGANTPLRELLPPPSVRGGAKVRHWSVGITTAPRRRPRLEQCLRSLASAGWPRPHLFVDGMAHVPADFSALSQTVRGEQLGAWPNFYLALIEMLMREPLADAYMVVQDDALFYDRENVREYLEGVLWPGERPGIVSLYCATPDAREQAGWATYPGRWKFGAVVFVFPREVAQQLVIAPPVFQHRWSADGQGLVGISDVVAEWAVATGTPVYFPSPSLVQHIGETSAIWLGSYDLTPQRRADDFVGARVRAERPPATAARLADFPEQRFPPAAAHAAEYRERTDHGRQRMARESVVLCGLCRDVAATLPTMIARIEHLAAQFHDCAIVLFENDSTDSTPQVLAQWARENPAVRIVSESLGQPRFLGGTSHDRTDRMAYYRNRCRQEVLEGFGDRAFVLVLDMDLEGGWSDDGIANTFGHDDWDFVGSNGLLIRSTNGSWSRVHYDSFAYQAVGANRTSRRDHINELSFERGEPLVPVWSCFGGVGVYRMEAFKAAEYGGEDCEHVVFHQSLRERGYGRLFLNPSQIVLYSPAESVP